MIRSSDIHTGKNQHGWDTTSYDYHAHIHRMERIPTRLPEIPQYPNVHKAFNNKVAYEEDHGGSDHYKHHHEDQNPVQFQEKIEVIEYERVDEEAGGKNRSGGKVYEFEESVNVEADAYIKQKRKGFELCKWKD
jgi:FMN phosphatase YigB (HAD superfamily)